MIYCPLADFLKVSTLVVRIELRPRERIIWDHKEREDSDISVTLSVQSENFQTVVLVAVRDLFDSILIKCEAYLYASLKLQGHWQTLPREVRSSPYTSLF